MSDNSAKVLSITAVWVSTAAIFIFGILDAHWSGRGAIEIMLITSLIICISASYATKKICDVFAPVAKKEDA